MRQLHPFSAFFFQGDEAQLSQPDTPHTSEEILRSKPNTLKHRKGCPAISRYKLQLLPLKLSGSISLAVFQGWMSSIPYQTAGKNRCPENIFFGSFLLLFRSKGSSLDPREIEGWISGLGLQRWI